MTMTSTDRLRQAVAGVLAPLCACLAAGCGSGSGTAGVTPNGPEQVIEQPYSVANAVSVPKAVCGPGSLPETDLQGRIPAADYTSGRAALGYTCNAELVGLYDVPGADGGLGGFKVLRYVDAQGQECAYYDTSSITPINIFGGNAGVNVLDMSRPESPELTTTLQTPAMLAPHESLLLHEQRGLLLAVLGNAATYPGLMDIYDVSHDCTQPQLLFSGIVAVLGHESGISNDGNTFYIGSATGGTMEAIDIRNPSSPVSLSKRVLHGHGVSVSDGDNLAYVSNIGSIPGGNVPPELTGKGLTIVDVSEVQLRSANAQMHEVTRLVWNGAGAPQYAAPFNHDGRQYLFQVDEFGSRVAPGPGAVRIIDVTDPANPTIVSDVRLEVHQSGTFATTAGDPGAGDGSIIGYSTHYCDVLQRDEPTLAACSAGLSGLRVFNISNPRAPREVAYFNPPDVTRNDGDTITTVSRPEFVPERKEIWYSATNGFYVVRLTNGAWPD